MNRIVAVAVAPIVADVLRSSQELRSRQPSVYSATILAPPFKIPNPQAEERIKRTLLRQEDSKPLAHRNAVPRPLVVGREARRVRRLGHLPVHDLL